MKLWSKVETMDTFLVVSVVSMILTKETYALPGQPRAYCEAMLFKPQCNSNNEVVVVTYGKYGRMKTGGCVKSDYGFVGCASDVLDQLDERCSGKRTCSIRIPDTRLRNSCPEDFKTYLDAAWQCLRVDMAECTQCRQNNMARLTSPEGRIASVVTRESKVQCGSTACPWVVEAKQGQKINVTLLDFGLATREEHASTDVCYMYAVIHEQGREEKRVCGGRKRESTAYISESHEIEIRLVGHQSSHANFILHYKVFGCPELNVENAFVEKVDGHSVQVSCNGNEEKWNMRCDGVKWRGEARQCPVVSNSEPATPIWSLPLGVLIAIISAIALVIGVCILTIGLVCLKRHQRPPEVQYTPDGQDVEFKEGVAPSRGKPQQRHYSTGPRNKKGKHVKQKYVYCEKPEMQQRPLPSVPHDIDDFVDESKYGQHLYQVTQYSTAQAQMLPVGQGGPHGAQVRLLTQRQTSCPTGRIHAVPPPRAGGSRQHSHDPQYFVLDADEVRLESIPGAGPQLQEAAALRARQLRHGITTYHEDRGPVTKPLLPTESEEDLAEAQAVALAAAQQTEHCHHGNEESNPPYPTSHCPSCQHGNPCAQEENKQTCSWP